MTNTTINIRLDILEKITDAAEKLNTSRRAIIVKLLLRSMNDIHKFHRGFTTVKYQPDEEKEKWHCFSIRFKPDEIEFWCDLRKIGKYSISYLVAIAVEKYLDEIIKKFVKVAYNYARHSNYVLYREVVEGVICWQCYWGLPMERLKTLNIEKYQIDETQ